MVDLGDWREMVDRNMFFLSFRLFCPSGFNLNLSSAFSAVTSDDSEISRSCGL